MASKYLQKYQVPEGFYDILHEFSREILRAQPEDILDYAANYFEHKCQGKEYYYESKSNIQRTGDEAKKYAPTPAANFAGQAQKVVATSNQKVPVAAVNATAGAAQSENRVPSQHSVKQSNSNRIPSGDASSRPRTQNSIKSDLSHPDEKRMTKEFVGDLYSSALNKAQKPSSAERSNEEVKSNPSPANKSNEGSREGNRTRGSNQAIESQNSNKLSAQEIPAETPGQGQGENEETQQEQEVLQGEEQAEYDRNQDEQQLEDAQNADAQEEGKEEEAAAQEEGQETGAQEEGQETGAQEEGQEEVAQEGGQEGEAQEGGQEGDGQEIEGQENLETPQEGQNPTNEEEGQGEQQEAEKQRVEEKVVLDGPVEEYENVAVKIQSVFRGSQARKATKKL